MHDSTEGLVNIVLPHEDQVGDSLYELDKLRW